MKRGVFVTGTDTGVGKTVASAALVHAIASRGVAVMPMKPIAAGAEMRGGRWVNEDSALLLRAAGRGLEALDDVTPILLAEPMAPHIAATREGRTISLAPVAAARERLERDAEFLVIEGVGGFQVPLGDDLDTVDLARAFALPVVIVVGLRLGCLSHALLTAAAVRAAGLPLAGWIANTIDPAMPVIDENVAALDGRMGAPRLGWLPHAPGAEAAVLAAHLDPSPLLA